MFHNLSHLYLHQTCVEYSCNPSLGGYGGMHTSGYENTLAWNRFVRLMAKFHFGVYSFKITLSHIHMSAITYIMIWILL